MVSEAHKLSPYFSRKSRRTNFVNCMGLTSSVIRFQLFLAVKKQLMLQLDIAHCCVLPYYLNVLS